MVLSTPREHVPTTTVSTTDLQWTKYCLDFFQGALSPNVMPPISPEASCLTKTKCLQAMPLNQGTSSPFPMWFSLLGVIIEPHEPDSEHWEFIYLTILFLISLPITIIFLCSLTGI